PVTQDPPVGVSDSNTYTGPIAPGDQLASNYSANASGYGVHSDWVGSFGGAVNNVDNGSIVDGQSLPFGGGNRDLMGGWVAQATLTSAAADGTASALGDADQATSDVYARCTDVASAAACLVPGL